MPWDRFVLGYHGCDESILEPVITGGDELKKSDNDYDWLGNGIYFWEESYLRALQWAQEQAKRPTSKIRNPAVLGAVIELGNCLNLVDAEYLNLVHDAFLQLQKMLQMAGNPMPKNKGRELKSRKLDCAVFETLHKLRAEEALQSFDTVRGFFVEGKELYPGAGLRQQDHVQLCVREEKHIVGYFLPRQLETKQVRTRQA